MAYCWLMHFHLSMLPTKPLYVNETGLLLGMGKLNDERAVEQLAGCLANLRKQNSAVEVKVQQHAR